MRTKRIPSNISYGLVCKKIAHSLLVVQLLFIWLPGCTNYKPQLSDLFSDDFHVRINTNPLHYDSDFRKICLMRIIHDDPDASYASPRTILFRLKPGTQFAWRSMPNISNDADFLMRSYGEIYFLMRIDQETDRRKFSGPLAVTDECVSSLIDRESPLPGFKEHLQADLFAMICDLYAIYGNQHPVDQKPFTLNWSEASKAIQLFDKTKEEGRSAAYVGYQSDALVIRIPVVTIENDKLITTGVGGFTAEVNRSDSTITEVWIDLN